MTRFHCIVIKNPGSPVYVQYQMFLRWFLSFQNFCHKLTKSLQCVEDADLPPNMCKRCHDRKLECSGPVEMAKGRPPKNNDQGRLDL